MNLRGAVESVAVAWTVLWVGWYLDHRREERDQRRALDAGVVCRQCGEHQTMNELLDPRETCSCSRVRR